MTLFSKASNILELPSPFGLLFDEMEKYESVAAKAVDQANLIVLAKDGGIIGGQRVTWTEKSAESVAEDDNEWVKWVRSGNGNSTAQFTLGDFRVLGQFLHELAGHVRRQPEGASHV